MYIVQHDGLQAQGRRPQDCINCYICVGKIQHGPTEKKIDISREVEITILSKQICSSLSREVCYMYKTFTD